MKDIEFILKELNKFRAGVSFKVEVAYDGKTDKFTAKIFNIIDSEAPPYASSALPSVEFVSDTLKMGMADALDWLNERYHKYKQ